MSQTYQRGDLYYADLGKGVGSEQEGYRPVVIVQNNVGNKYSPTVIIAAITSKVDVKPKLPTHYFVNAEDGLELPSVILLEQLRTVDKRRLGKYIGHLKKRHIDGLNNALATSIDLIRNASDAIALCPYHEHADCRHGREFRCPRKEKGGRGEHGEADHTQRSGPIIGNQRCYIG